MRKALWVIVGLLVVAVAGAVGYKAWFFLYPPLAFVAPLDPSCDLHQGPCKTNVPGGSVRFSIEPRPVRAMEPLALEVWGEGLAVHGVEVDFNGVDMNMGFNRFALQEKGAGRFFGNAVLPICVRNRMAWEAKVLLRTDEGIVAVPFRFDTVREP